MLLQAANAVRGSCSPGSAEARRQLLAAADREPAIDRRSAVADGQAHPARARTGPEAGPPQGAQSRPDPVQPGRQARRHLADRERPHPRVLHLAARARDHARLLACRQFRRRPRSVRRRRASMVRRRIQQLQRRAPARKGAARAGRRDPESRDRPDRRPDLQGQMLFGAGADAGHALDHPAARASAAASGRTLRRRGSRRHRDRRRLHPCRHRPHGRRDPAMGHDQPEADAGEGNRR